MIKRIWMALAALAMVASSSLAMAHGDEDNGAAATPVGVSIAPRMEAATDALELVAAAKADDLTIWIDGFADNVPVTGATVSVTVDGKTGQAKAANGIYTYSDDGLQKPGAHELSFLVSHDGAFESLSGTLTVPTSAADTTAGPPIWRWLLIGHWW